MNHDNEYEKILRRAQETRGDTVTGPTEWRYNAPAYAWEYGCWDTAFGWWTTLATVTDARVAMFGPEQSAAAVHAICGSVPPPLLGYQPPATQKDHATMTTQPEDTPPGLGTLTPKAGS